jgi:hypothetical protein
MPKKPKRSRLQKLQNSWEKSSAEERADFMRWLEASGVSARQAAPATMSEAPIASGRYLTSSTVARVKATMAVRAVSAEEVMAELGFGPDDPSLGRAMDDSASLRLVIVAALEKWLAAHERRPEESEQER